MRATSGGLKRKTDCVGHYPKSPRRLLQALGIERPGEIDIEAIAFFCDATVVYEPTEGCAGRLLGYEDQAIITVDSGSTRARQRFTAAHELGHWLRDRGKVSQFKCEDRDMVSRWGEENPERRANRFAADLLLPESMFRPDAKEKGIVFGTVRQLAEKYRTSLTSTAIRLVELGSLPGMIVCHEPGVQRWRWFVRGPLVPEQVWPKDLPGRDSVAYGLLEGESPGGEREISASEWCEGEGLERFPLHEDSLALGGFVLSLLWWQDESHLLALVSEE